MKVQCQIISGSRLLLYIMLRITVFLLVCFMATICDNAVVRTRVHLFYGHFTRYHDPIMQRVVQKVSVLSALRELQLMYFDLLHPFLNSVHVES